MWLKQLLHRSMLADNSGQGYTEYVVLLAAVLAIAAVVVATIALVGSVFQRQQGRINALP
jgi:Flp pilus assembly pilin Flp